MLFLRFFPNFFFCLFCINFLNNNLIKCLIEKIESNNRKKTSSQLPNLIRQYFFLDHLNKIKHQFFLQKIKNVNYIFCFFKYKIKKEDC